MSHDPYTHDRSDSVDGIGKPQASGNNGGCVEVANFACGCCIVSDSKDPQRAHLAFDLRERVAVLIATAGGGDERFALPESIRMAFIEALQKNDMSLVWKAVEHEESLLAPVSC